MNRAHTLIVGGGPAGLSTALFLAHAAPQEADRIVVLEKARYPREKFCAGAIGARADHLLGTIGVAVDVPSVPISGLAVRALGETRIVREKDIGRVIRRAEFDAELARIARARGITILEDARVLTVRSRLDRVEVETTRGPLSSQVLVGADGVGSVVRRCLQVPASPWHAQALEVDTEPVQSDLDRDVLLFDLSRRDLRGYYWDFPTTVAGTPMVCRGVYYLTGSPHLEIQGILEHELAQRGLALSNYRQKRFAERGYAGTFPSRHRVLLVGEAAGIDAVTGEGIAQAIQYGAAAGRYLARKFLDRDFQFVDWAREAASQSIGRDLRLRRMALGLAYGPRRCRVERFLLDTPDFLRVGLQHFGGKPWSRAAVLRGSLAAAKAAGAALLTRAAA